ncbi:hypothetical protein ACQZ6A_20355 [Agrobacterium vitis]
MRSIAKLMGVEIAGTDFSTLSRRGNGLVLPKEARNKAIRAGPSCGGQQRPEGLWLG